MTMEARREGDPWSENMGHVDFGGFYLTHAIWHNGYGACPETGVRSHAAGLKDFRLIQHNSRNWSLVTVVTLAALAKGWDQERIATIIGWLDYRYRARPRRL